jgi:hypothetical protein
MTCMHVLGLIDAGPFADYPRTHLDAAWEHARQCPTCGPALEAATTLAADLAALSQVTPPPDMTASILGRVARVEHAQSAAPSRAHDWSFWPTIGALVVGLAIVLSIVPAPVHIASFRTGGITSGPVAMPSTNAEALALAAGLVLYAAGVFGVLGTRRWR